MTIAEMIAVMQAYEEGKEIEFYDKSTGTWETAEPPLWDWGIFQYRVKPEEPQYRPYKDCDEMVEDFKARFNVSCPSYGRPLVWVRYRDIGTVYFVEGFVHNQNYIRVTGAICDFSDLVTNYEYLDGTPVGKLVEE